MFSQRQFENELVVTPLSDGRRWRITQAFHYTTDAGMIIEVPEGEVTDFASIPRFLWPVLPPTGTYTRAAVIHDHLYADHRKQVAHYSRAFADAILLEALADCGCSRLVTNVIWIGVRLGGWWAWSKKSR
jgi:hypothetical protein